MITAGKLYRAKQGIAFFNSYYKNDDDEEIWIEQGTTLLYIGISKLTDVSTYEICLFLYPKTMRNIFRLKIDFNESWLEEVKC